MIKRASMNWEKRFVTSFTSVSLKVIFVNSFSALLLALQKFSSHISHTVQQVAGDVRISFPEMDLSNPDSLMKDEDALKVLDEVAYDWTKIIANVIEKELKKVPQGQGPMAEIEFWRERNANLCTLHEQLSLPAAKTIVKIVSDAETVNHGPLGTQLAELTKYYTEAKDNTKFLGTLERHLKTILTGSLTTVQASMEYICYCRYFIILM